MAPQLQPVHAQLIAFDKWSEQLQLGDNKYHFKTYPRSFLGEQALNLPNGGGQHFSTYLVAGLVTDATGVSEIKPKHVYNITPKGWALKGDVRFARLTEDVATVANAANTGIMYINLESEATRSPPAVIERIFKTMIGERPRGGRRSGIERDREEAEESSGSLQEGNDPRSIAPLAVRDRMVRLRSVANTFLGSEVVEWVLASTSVMSREEAIELADTFVTNLWISLAGSADASATSPVSPPPSSDSGGASMRIRDSKNAVYHLTSLGTLVAGWATTARPLSYAPTSGARSQRVSVEISSATAPSSSYSPMSPSVEDDAVFEWETCHRNLISMDGSEVRSATSADGAEKRDSLTVTGASIAAAARMKRISMRPGALSATSQKAPHDVASPTLSPSAIAGRKSSRQGSIAAPAVTTATDGDMGAFNVDQIRESNPTRLIQILTTDTLRESFHSCVRAMYCEENLYFWEDVNAFRTLYSTAVVIPGQPMSPQSTRTEDKMLLPHAMALYLKYIITDAPFELNVNIGIKRQVETVMQRVDTALLEHINPDSIATEEKIVVGSIVKSSVGGGIDPLDKFPSSTAVEGLTVALFDACEHHIFSLMANDSVPKFVKTKEYKDILMDLYACGRLKWWRQAEDGAAESGNFNTATKFSMDSGMDNDANGGCNEGMEEERRGAMAGQRRSIVVRIMPALQLKEVGEELDAITKSSLPMDEDGESGDVIKRPSSSVVEAMPVSAGVSPSQ